MYMYIICTYTHTHIQHITNSLDFPALFFPCHSFCRLMALVGLVIQNSALILTMKQVCVRVRVRVRVCADYETGPNDEQVCIT